MFSDHDSGYSFKSVNEMVIAHEYKIKELTKENKELYHMMYELWQEMEKMREREQFKEKVIFEVMKICVIPLQNSLPYRYDDNHGTENVQENQRRLFDQNLPNL